MPRRPRLIAVPLLAVLALVGCRSTASAPATEPSVMSDPAARVRIQGEAVYFEKILMPEGARLRVQVVDSQRADSAHAILAERVTTVGNGPYEFEIDLPRDRLHDGGAYTLHASVAMPDGALRFVTETRVPLAIAAGSTDVHIGRIRLHLVQPN